MLARAIGELFVRAGERARATHVRPLEMELARIAAPVNGRVGIAAVHVETGLAVSLNGGARFPLASAVKIPIAVQFLSRVDRGELALDTMMAIEPRHLRPGAGIIARRFRIPGVALSLRNLLELSLIVSDNTAADMVLELSGGVGSVRARLEALALTDISVERSILQLLADIEGVTDVPHGGVAPERWRAMVAAVPRERRDAAERAFFADPRDTATPDAIARLLASVWQGRALGPSTTALLQDILMRCETGEDRLKGSLPARTPVAHKTGTIEGARSHGARYPMVVNDVGVIDLPEAAGRVAVAVFIAGSPRDAQTQARTIARLGRATHDAFASSRL